jgi:hypothetical protein
MNSQVLGLRVAGTVFGLLFFGPLLRLATGTEIVIGGHPMPYWPSALGCVVLGGLSLWMWRLSKTPSK